MARILKSDGTGSGPEVRRAAEMLDAGGIVAFPTETVFALAAAHDLPTAISRLAALKERGADKPFAALVSDVSDVAKFVSVIPPVARMLMDAFWPGPLTIVLATSRGSSEAIGLRMPDHALARAIVRAARHPVAATSANIAGEREAVSAREVAELFRNKIDLIVNDGKTCTGRPSTVVKVTWESWRILREGAIPAERIAHWLADAGSP
jgi:L-threonylcarbamoyladenylate synthase